MFSLKIAIIEGFIALVGLAGLNALESSMKKSEYLLFIRIGVISIILNIMIFVFLLLSFSQVTFAEGEQGPQGNRGNRGDTGSDGGFKACGNNNLTAENVKFSIKSRELQLPKKPIIVDT